MGDQQHAVIATWPTTLSIDFTLMQPNYKSLIGDGALESPLYIVRESGDSDMVGAAKHRQQLDHVGAVAAHLSQ